MMQQNEIEQLSEAFSVVGIRFDTMIRPYLFLYEDYSWCVAAHDAKGLTGGFVVHAIPCLERISYDAWEEWYAFGEDISHIILYTSKKQNTNQNVMIATNDHNHPRMVQNRTWYYYRDEAVQPLRRKIFEDGVQI